MQFGCSHRTPLITTTLSFLSPPHAVCYWLKQFLVWCSVKSQARTSVCVSQHRDSVCLCIDHVYTLYLVWLTWVLPWGLPLFFYTGALQCGVLQVIPLLFPSSVLRSCFFTDSFRVWCQSTAFFSFSLFKQFLCFAYSRLQSSCSLVPANWQLSAIMKSVRICLPKLKFIEDALHSSCNIC